MALGCGCQTTNLVPRIAVPEDNPSFPYIYPTVDRNGVFTLDAELLAQFQSTWQGTGGDGITITQGTDTYQHEPTISICVDPASEIPLSFVNVGGEQCLTATAIPETDWTSPNTATADGITVTLAGTANHDPSFAIAIADGAPFAINADGTLDFTGDLSTFSCSDLNGCSISALADVNLDGSQTAGHVLVFNDEGLLVNITSSQMIGEALTQQAGVTIPAAPTTGGPYTLQWDPGGAGFTWV